MPTDTEKENPAESQKRRDSKRRRQLLLLRKRVRHLRKKADWLCEAAGDFKDVLDTTNDLLTDLAEILELIAESGLFPDSISEELARDSERIGGLRKRVDSMGSVAGLAVDICTISELTERSVDRVIEMIEDRLQGLPGGPTDWPIEFVRGYHPPNLPFPGNAFRRRMESASAVGSKMFIIAVVTTAALWYLADTWSPQVPDPPGVPGPPGRFVPLTPVVNDGVLSSEVPTVTPAPAGILRIIPDAIRLLPDGQAGIRMVIDDGGRAIPVEAEVESDDTQVVSVNVTGTGTANVVGQRPGQTVIRAFWNDGSTTHIAEVVAQVMQP